MIEDTDIKNAISTLVPDTISNKIQTYFQTRLYTLTSDFINYVKGANIAGFLKVADAMLDQGIV